MPACAHTGDPRTDTQSVAGAAPLRAGSSPVPPQRKRVQQARLLLGGTERVAQIEGKLQRLAPGAPEDDRRQALDALEVAPIGRLHALIRQVAPDDEGILADVVLRLCQHAVAVRVAA